MDVLPNVDDLVDEDGGVHRSPTVDRMKTDVAEIAKARSEPGPFINSYQEIGDAIPKNGTEKPDFCWLQSPYSGEKGNGCFVEIQEADEVQEAEVACQPAPKPETGLPEGA
jgi:hypothetical protein